MNAIPLYHQDGRPTDIFYCEKCRVVHRTRAEADQCCLPRPCVCGKPCQQFMTLCPDCESKRWRAAELERETARYAKAQKIDSSVYEGPILPPHSDEYFESVDEYLDHCHDEGLDPGEYVWSCTVQPVIKLNTDDVVEWILRDEGLPEDFDTDSILGIDDLQKACDVFNAANSENRVWILDYSRVVLLPPIKTQ